MLFLLLGKLGGLFRKFKKVVYASVDNLILAISSRKVVIENLALIESFRKLCVYVSMCFFLPLR